MNLDSEEEGALYVGCSGGRNTVGTWSMSFKNAPGDSSAVAIHVKGLRGGHSGLEIDKGRGNSIKILNRVLIALEKVDARLSMIEGGNKSNAIPREAEALVYIPKRSIKKARAIVEQWNSILKAELATVEPDLSITMEEVQLKKKGKVIKKAQWKMLAQTIAALPHGVSK